MTEYAPQHRSSEEVIDTNEADSRAALEREISTIVDEARQIGMDDSTIASVLVNAGITINPRTRDIVPHQE